MNKFILTTNVELFQYFMQSMPDQEIYQHIAATFLMTRDNINFSEEMYSMMNDLGIESIIFPSIAVQNLQKLLHVIVEAHVDTIAGIRLSGVKSQTLEDYQEFHNADVNSFPLDDIVKYTFDKYPVNPEHYQKAAHADGTFTWTKSLPHSIQTGGVIFDTPYSGWPQ